MKSLTNSTVRTIPIQKVFLKQILTVIAPGSIVTERSSITPPGSKIVTTHRDNVTGTTTVHSIISDAIDASLAIHITSISITNFSKSLMHNIQSKRRRSSILNDFQLILPN
ncbi:hypothetical protein QL285_009213 [Trifolium repens]|nr:hypothetical protein QL285_009213 [Trifolium repens]